MQHKSNIQIIKQISTLDNSLLLKVMGTKSLISMKYSILALNALTNIIKFAFDELNAIFDSK